MNRRSAPLSIRVTFPFCRFTTAAVAAAVASGFLASTGRAADEPTAQQLLEQIQQLQRQVDELQARERAPQFLQESSDTAAQDQPDARVRVLQDAETRAAPSPTLGPPAAFTAGHDGRFILRSADGRFLLNPNFQMQFRSVTNFSDEGAGTFNDVEHGLEVRRLKIGFRGHAFTEDLSYDILFAFSRDGGLARLENAFIDYIPGRTEPGPAGQLGVRIGQFKDLTFQEEFISSARQLAVDHSLVNREIGGGNIEYIQGVGPLFKSERLNAALFYTEGANSGNTPWQAMQWDYGVAGRVDFLLFGTQKAMDDFTALNTDEDSARIGAGFHYAALGGTRVVWHSVDAQYETTGGLGLFAAYYGRWTEGNLGDAFDVGGLVQVGQLIGRSGWEVFGRYDFVLFDAPLTLGADTQDLFHEFTAGVNRYWKDHKLKLTIDAVYLPSGNPGGHTGIGLRDNEGGFEDQIAIRGQFQLLL